MRMNASLIIKIQIQKCVQYVQYMQFWNKIPKIKGGMPELLLKYNFKMWAM